MIVVKQALPQTADRRTLTWLLVANILYPQALFHVVCNHRPPIQLPWAILMSINKALNASVIVQQRGKAMTYFRDKTIVIVSKPLSQAIVALTNGTLSQAIIETSSSMTSSSIDSLVAQCVRSAATGRGMLLQCTPSTQHESGWGCCPTHPSSPVAECPY